MMDAGQWAKQAIHAYRDAVRIDPQIESGALARVSAVIRRAQLEAINDCLRRAQKAMNDAPLRDQRAFGRVVDLLADFALLVHDPQQVSRR